MKKISLKQLDLKEVEQLSREQLKDVLGGTFGSGTDDCQTPGDTCTTADSTSGRCNYIGEMLVCS
ncbi:MAG: TIGR04149 family rSAM-modified RiPP [Sphingobacterium sp.]